MAPIGHSRSLKDKRDEEEYDYEEMTKRMREEKRMWKDVVEDR